MSLARAASVISRASDQAVWPWQAGPFRLWSLWEIMNQIRAKLLCIRASSFIELQENYERVSGLDPQTIETLNEVFQTQLGFALKECEQFGLHDAIQVLNRVRRDTLVMKLDASALSREANRAAMAYVDNLNKATFVFVRPDLGQYVEHEQLFGPEIAAKFASARADIKAAGNCLAVGCHTAAVFHLMRVTELGLRAFCGHLGFDEVVDKYDRTGQSQHEYRPVEYATWEKILGQLQGKVEAKITSFSDRKDKQVAQEFYVPIVQEIWALKEAWRNHVMHVRREYIEEDALAAMAHVKRLMTRLVERVEEA